MIEKANDADGTGCENSAARDNTGTRQYKQN